MRKIEIIISSDFDFYKATESKWEEEVVFKLNI